MVSDKGWQKNEEARLCRFYVIGKAKSASKQRWLRRPIAAYPMPVVSGRSLGVAARALTQFLSCIAQQMPMNFQVLLVRDIATWYRWLDEFGLTCVSEPD